MGPKQTVSWLNFGITTACILGLAISYYAYVVETTKEKDESYEALCDINEHVSCTKAFASKYGKGFGVIPKTSIFYLPNSVYGMIFYTLFLILSASNKRLPTAATVVLGVLSIFTAIYLAYILYLLNDICVVCVSTYILNAITLTFAVRKYRILFVNGKRQKKMK